MKHITEKGIRVIALLLILALSVALWVETKSPYAIQKKNMSIARVFVEAVKPSLQEKADFQDASIDVFTGSKLVTSPRIMIWRMPNQKTEVRCG